MKILKDFFCKPLVGGILFALAGSVFAIDPLKLDGKEFVYRISSDEIHSFTPPDQKDNPLWEEMISFSYAGYVKNEEELQSLAIKIRNVFSQKGRLIKAFKVDPANNESSKFLIVAVMAGGNAAEAVLARVGIVNNSGVVLVYAHRFYGEGKAEDLIAWFQKNGFRMEREILDFRSVPSKSVFLEAGK